MRALQDVPAVAIEGGELPLGGGLLALVRPALDRVDAGGVVAVRSRSPGLRDELPSYCRLDRHEYLGRQTGEDGADVHLIRRGPFSVPRGREETGVRLARPTASQMLAAVPMPEQADVHSGFAPRGARVEPGGPAFPFSYLRRDQVAPPEIGQLYDQGVSQQWSAKEIAWDRIAPLPEALERAVDQLMTFLAENELSALYVPSKFLPAIHPAYAEVAMVLAQQLADEARHIDVFLKRARSGGGGVGISSAITAYSLHSLLLPTDFTEATFLLSVLGEGTFIDLLRYIEVHAPDEPTAEIMRRARQDEARHVHFGLAHVRHALAHDASLYGRLEAAVQRRAANLSAVHGVPAPVQDALTILAARGDDPPSVRRGHEQFRELLDTMSKNRIARLINAGFTREQAEVLSGLHTANFM